ncbi:solute carrier family 32 (vesicular inhibitory amino acid transporter) [Cryptococcus neoformans c8]|nr:solute carrier family 32 (vesicular inhibitory amino acid transporter) [Cryptococcus neoformans var. grubii AD1-83a]OXG47772.1 solute carrier family 32 (vesicular inhibitory amino acid transporter) [Cryptococcus neoformans var. grubii MW-RSA1955]OXG51132.1 solute carrier family 32 (vesicular inhibitory amino acid transporter) [Cryptococcus neoformans var. grubii CHC193]OXG65740.1 solute carrier family 32 (vesicular inhibitory amino acid transporter) [Cryptococcus neoformans var. grubii c8]OX
MSLSQGKSVPIPNLGPKHESRKKGHVMQSSLELVFSYSRSQQMHYGSRSAPSFLDDSSFRGDQFYVDDHDEDQNHNDIYDTMERIGEDEFEGRDLSGIWADLNPAGAISEGNECGTREELGQDSHITRRSSEEPVLFLSDSMPISPIFQPQPSANQGSTVNTLPPDGVGSIQGPFLAAMRSPPLAPVLPHPGSRDKSYYIEAGSSFSPRTPKRWNSHTGDDSTPMETRDSTVLVPSSPQCLGKGKSAENRPLLDGRPTEGYASIQPQNETRRKSSRRKPSKGGQSTEGQTLFNATAVLVGIGLLSLPLAFAYAGWIGGTIMLLSFGWLTCYTAKLLARLIRADGRMMGYTDIGLRAFGGWAGAGINLLFCMELFALSVALILLFGDTLNVLYPSIPSSVWKLIGFFVIVPTALLPLRLLSLPSLLSSISSLLLIIVLLIDGFLPSPEPSSISTGSLLHPSPTSLSPEWSRGNWLGGIGLALAGFGGHAVMPSLARDMKQPEKFDRVVNWAFAIATGISFTAGAAGYLMFGKTVSDEVGLSSSPHFSFFSKRFPQLMEYCKNT